MLIINDPHKTINLKGIAIGNGYLDVILLYAKSLVFWSFYHSLFGKAEMDAIVSNCCSYGIFSHETCDFIHNPNGMCIAAVLHSFEWLKSINPYNIYNDCPPISLTNNEEYTRTRNYVDQQLIMSNLRTVEQLSNSDATTELSHPHYYCPRGGEYATYYLRRSDVRKAIHVPDFVQKWYECSDVIFKTYVRQYLTMRPQIQEIIMKTKHLRVTIYNGDVDAVCNAVGDEW